MNEEHQEHLGGSSMSIEDCSPQKNRNIDDASIEELNEMLKQAETEFHIFLIREAKWEEWYGDFRLVGWSALGVISISAFISFFIFGELGPSPNSETRDAVLLLVILIFFVPLLVISSYIVWRLRGVFTKLLWAWDQYSKRYEADQERQMHVQRITEIKKRIDEAK